MVTCALARKNNEALTRARNEPSILIVDDHPAVREALALRIGRQPDLEVCGEAADMSEALRLVADTQPDLAVVDISLKTGSGIDLIKRIKDRNDTSACWSGQRTASRSTPSVRSGRALGYINKDQATDKIVDAIRRVLEGKVYLSDAMAEKMLQRTVAATERSARSPLEALADRELEVFRLIGQGVKTAEIAERLHLSVKTVETYRDRIRQKLDLSDGTARALCDEVGGGEWVSHACTGRFRVWLWHTQRVVPLDWPLGGRRRIPRSRR